MSAAELEVATPAKLLPVRQRDRRKRKKNSAPPTPKRIRDWQRRRDYGKHEVARKAARKSGTHVRTLLAQQASRAEKRQRLLFPTYVPELLQETRSSIALRIAGWVAFSWVLHGHSELVGSYGELGRLVGCSRSAAEKWIYWLQERGWLMGHWHYRRDNDGVCWEESKSYAPGLLLRAAIGAANDRRAATGRASFFAPEYQDPTKEGTVVSLRQKENTAPRARVGGEAEASAAKVSASPTLGFRRPRAASRVDDLDAAASPESTDARRADEGKGSPGEAAVPSHAAPEPSSSPSAATSDAPGAATAPAAPARPAPRYPGRQVAVDRAIRDIVDSGHGSDGKAYCQLLLRILE